jgi:hypothetical protein
MDVLEEQRDLKDLYQTKMPESLNHDFKGMDPVHVKKFVDLHMHIKKELEIEQIKNNKKYETIN